jgi:hypothetical protein
MYSHNLSQFSGNSKNAATSSNRHSSDEDSLLGNLDDLNILNDSKSQQQPQKPTYHHSKSYPNTSDIVDALLMHSPSPPHNLLSYAQHQAYTHQIQQQQQQHHYQQQQMPQLSNIVYRKVRPEPINEKTLVSTAVGFFQDLVGSDTSKTQAQSNSSNLACETKEQIEWLHFEYFNLLDSSTDTDSSSSSKTKFNSSPYANSNILLVCGYKTGFSVWSIDLNGVATEALSIKEPHITHVKLLQIESTAKLLVAICKLIHADSSTSSNDTTDYDLNSLSTSPQQNTLLTASTSSSSISSLQPSQPQANSSRHNNQNNSHHPNYHHYHQHNSQPQQKISILNLLSGEILNEIVFNGDVLEMKSNAHLLCINSWNRIDAFDLVRFEHRFSVNSCYSQVSKSTGQSINPFALGNRWLAFADNKYHSLISSLGGVSTGVEQSYTATVLNTAKSITKGLAKISETVVNSVVSKSKSDHQKSNGEHSPRLSMKSKTRHDSKEEYQAGLCTILDTKKYTNTNANPRSLHDENQTWIIAHFLAHHQEPLYALEFNPTGRLLVTADSLGQYFNVFQINVNSFKSTRTVVKHLYSLHRGDTNAKVRHMSFSSDSRWLAISTKRGTTHIFPLNSYGGAVNARTHSKPHVVNRTSKHQRTAGFQDQDSMMDYADSSSSSMSGFHGDHYNTGNVGGGGGSSKFSMTHINVNSNSKDMQQHYQMQQMLQQQYDNSCSHPIVLQNNNPKLKSLFEPLVIPAYGQLKQPNVNSTFQSSVLSSTNSYLMMTAGAGHSQQQQHQVHNFVDSQSGGAGVSGSTSSMNVSGLLNGSNLAASAFSSAALVTENVTNFASNTSNMIQYDNVQAVAVFAESRGYLTPEEPRDFSMNRLKAANSLFIISDVNGNLVEYILDVLVDTNKSTGHKPTNDSPIQLKITTKAQWPLQRFVSSDEVNYPIELDNPLIMDDFYRTNLRKQSTSAAAAATNDSLSLSPNSIDLYATAQNSLSSLGSQTNNNNNTNDWIKQVEVSTHIGPHRRLFMGPQFVFKTFNSSLTTTLLNPTSSSVMSDVETPMIDLAGDIELNSLDLNTANSLANNTRKTTMPMQIGGNNRPINKNHCYQKYSCTPTYIEVGAGSFQEGMPFSNSRNGSQRSLNNDNLSGGDNLIETLADAMNELNNADTKSVYTHYKTTSTQQQQQPSSHQQILKPNLLLMNAASHNSHRAIPILTAPSSVSSNSSTSYISINQNLTQSNVPVTTVNTSLTSCTSSSGTSSSSSSSTTSNNDDNDSIASSNGSTTTFALSSIGASGTKKQDENDENLFRHKSHHHHHHHSSSHRRNNEQAQSLENMPFQDDTNLL